MTSVQRFLSGHNNLVRTAVLSASSVRASSAIERTAARRAGGGRVRLVGDYVGHEAADIDVEIVATGGVPRASVPTVAGVGNGKLIVLDVESTATLQALTFTLRDLGVQTESARLDVREVAIRARAPGAAGNSIRITVTPAITRTATDYALLAPWTAGAKTQTGPQWDFGGLPLSAAGALDSASPRIQFGFDPTVYRPYREFKDGAWQHGLSPALERDLAAGTRIWAITGGYTVAVAVADGTSTETYPALVTFHDLLTALEASALVEVAGVVVADRSIGGQAAIDIPLRTSAWLYALAGKVKLDQVAVPAAAPTQSITIKCTNADTVGRERWSVTGTVTGDMPAALTGDLYTHAAAVFLVPAISPATADGGEWSFKYEPTTRADGEGAPSICIRPFKFGRNAKGNTVTFKYQRRPPADCKCSTMPTPKLSMQCLGLTTEDEMALDAEYQNRLEALYEWQAGFIASNAILAAQNAEYGRVLAEPVDIAIAKGVTSILAEALAEIYGSGAARAVWDTYLTAAQAELLEYDGLVKIETGAGRNAPQWAPGVFFPAGTYVKPSTRNGNLYLVVVGGGTGEDEPDWSTATPPIIDAEVSYETLAPYWQASSAVATGAKLEPGNGTRYVCTTAGTTASAEPYWATSGPVNDGTVVWSIVSGTATGRKLIDTETSIKISGGGIVAGTGTSAVAATSTFTPATVDIIPDDTEHFRLGAVAYRSRVLVTSGPSSGYFEDVWGRSMADSQSLARTKAAELARTKGSTATSGGAAGTQPERAAIERTEIITRLETEPYLDKVRAQMDHVRTLAGIVPKSDASSDAGACWRDYPGETHWWVDVDGYYLPAFTNKPYISARRNTETGEAYSTMEFGFGLVVACPERLKVDDTLTIKILTIDGDRPYQVGDEAIIETIAAGPAWLAGGVDGTDALTWSVLGSSTGALPDYVVPLSGTAPTYSASGIEARIALGGIPFALGDAFAVAVEAGQFRWRRDAGAWSAAADIPASGPVALADGISALFDAGAAPSFVPDDAFGFRVHQPNAAGHVRTGHDPAWRWAGAEAEITIDFGDLYDVSSIAVARFELPPSGGMFAQLSADGLAWSSAIGLDAGRPVAVAMLATPAEARYLRVSVYGATGGAIGWIWAGVPVTTRYHATTCEPSRRYAVGRGNGLNPSSLYAGRGVGWSVAWDAQLFDADVQKLVDIVDWMHANDEPMVFVPHHLHWRDAALVSVGSDALVLPDYHHYQPNNADHRLLSAALTLDAVIA